MIGSSPSGNCLMKLDIGEICCGASKLRVAVIVPSADAVKPDDDVPTATRAVVGSPASTAAASSLVMSLATNAVTVAATSVSTNSTMPGVASAKASNETPHSLIRNI